MTVPILLRAIVSFRIATVPAPQATEEEVVEEVSNARMFRDGMTLMETTAPFMQRVTTARFLAQNSRTMDTPPMRLAVPVAAAILMEEEEAAEEEEAEIMVSVSNRSTPYSALACFFLLLSSIYCHSFSLRLAALVQLCR
jgi:hypothetical protein